MFGNVSRVRLLILKDDETDFTGWTYLLQFVDSKNIVEQGREAYNSFLHRSTHIWIGRVIFLVAI